MVWQDIFIPFNKIHERDRQTERQTDGRTPRDDIGRACIAPGGKNDRARERDETSRSEAV